MERDFFTLVEDAHGTPKPLSPTPRVLCKKRSHVDKFGDCVPFVLCDGGPEVSLSR